MISLSVQNLSKDFQIENQQKQILKNISIDFPNTGIIGILGKNGAGKTTFIKSCVNLISYTGTISYFGQELQSIQKKSLHTQYYTALFEGNRNIYWKLTPLENIKYFAGLRGIKFNSIKDYVNILLDTLNMKSKANSLVESLSRGMQQKTALIMALAFNTPIIFLDEPTLGLDLESKNNLICFFKQNKIIEDKLIVISSHDLDFITSVCNDIFLLKEGHLYKYEKDIIQTKFRIISKQDLPLLGEYRQNQILDGYSYELPNNLNILSKLSPKELSNIISITNLKHDLEAFISK